MFTVWKFRTPVTRRPRPGPHARRRRPVRLAGRELRRSVSKRFHFRFAVIRSFTDWKLRTVIATTTSVLERFFPGKSGSRHLWSVCLRVLGHRSPHDFDLTPYYRTAAVKCRRRVKRSSQTTRGPFAKTDRSIRSIRKRRGLCFSPSVWENSNATKNDIYF